MLPHANSHHAPLPLAVHGSEVVSAAYMPHFERLIAHGEGTTHLPFLTLPTNSALALRPLIEDIITPTFVMLTFEAHALHLQAIGSCFVFLHPLIAHFQLPCVVSLHTLQGLEVFSNTNLCLCILSPFVDGAPTAFRARPKPLCPLVLHRARLALKAEHMLPPLSVPLWLLH
jgi:hypothetical protein